MIWRLMAAPFIGLAFVIFLPMIAFAALGMAAFDVVRSSCIRHHAGSR